MEYSLLRLKSVDSTNKYTSELLRQNDIEEGTVVVTGNQEKGKGRQNKNWESAPGLNLTFSLVLKPAFLSAEQSFLISECVAMALVKVFSAYGVATKVKWPNDIFAGKGKIAGILIENAFSGSSIRHSIVGIGINVNQVTFGMYPYEPVSLKTILGRDVDLERLLEVVLDKIRETYRELKNSPIQIHQGFNRSLLGLGQEQEFEYTGTVFYGRIEGVQEDGKLVIKTSEGEKTFHSGSLLFRQILSEGFLQAG